MTAVGTPRAEISRPSILEDLTRAWHFQREAVFRWEQKTDWNTNLSYHLVLRSHDATVDDQVRRICKKPTAFYWLQSVQTGAPDALEKTCTPGIIFASLFEEWYRRSVPLNIEFGHFLATPVRIAATGPTTLPGIVRAHRSVYEQAQQLSAGLEHYAVHPLFPAIILVCDPIDLDGRLERQPDGNFGLREVADIQSVLVVRTGYKIGNGANGSNAGLNVSLDSLAEFALPLGLRRADSGVQVVRVPLSAAVQFVIDLEEQIQDQTVQHVDKSLCKHRFPGGYDRDIRYDPDLWAHAMLAAGEENGYNMRDARESVLRVRARLEGKRSESEFEHEWFGIR